ncbi:MAG: glycoside hydrolase family 3 protein [Candidatus Latescibacterota bacterium]|nr:glycoside hydrolase family 3 protein [Candidatus Latescibacterota bacterium]
MELDIKIGQLLMAGFRGLTADPDDPIIRDIRRHHLGGVVLFDCDVPLASDERKIQSAAQVRALIGTLQEAAAKPLLVAVDQEGGQVRRLREAVDFPPLPSAQALGAGGDPEQTRRAAAETARALVELGFNLNLAPVVDLNLNPQSPVIGGIERCFSADPAEVVQHARAFVEGHRQYGVPCTLKHFPGHGSAADDSHFDLVDVTQTWSRVELEPYAELIAAGLADAIMTAHVFNRNLDPDFPATLSQAAIGDLLRGELHYDGVVITDDVQMGAVANHYGLETAVERTLMAGVDIVVLANNTLYEEDAVPRVCACIRRLVAEGRIDEGRIDASCTRIAKLKGLAA